MLFITVLIYLACCVERDLVEQAFIKIKSNDILISLVKVISSTIYIVVLKQQGYKIGSAYSYIFLFVSGT